MAMGMDAPSGLVQLLWTTQLGVLMSLMVLSIAFMCWMRSKGAVAYCLWMAVIFAPTLALNRPFFGEVYQSLVPDLPWVQMWGPPFAVLVSGSLFSGWFVEGSYRGKPQLVALALAVVAVLAAVVAWVAPAAWVQLISIGSVVVGGLIYAGASLWFGRHGSHVGTRLGIGVLLFVLAVALHGALLLGWLHSLVFHVIVAVVDIVGLSAVSVLCIQNCLHTAKTAAMHNRLQADLDPITNLLTPKAFVRRLQKALSQLKGGHDVYAVVTVVVDHPPGLVERLGVGSVYDALGLVAARIRDKVGFLTPTGRYYDRCFMVLIDSPQSEQLVNNLVSSLASSLRAPLMLQGAHNEPQQVQLNVGVAAIYFDEREDISSVLYRAENAALKACGQGAEASPFGPVADPRSERWSSLFPSTVA